jgi:hypothetical protein
LSTFGLRCRTRMSSISSNTITPSVTNHAHVGAEILAKSEPLSAASKCKEIYLVSLFLAPDFDSDLAMIAWAAARRAIGTRNGLHET